MNDKKFHLSPLAFCLAAAMSAGAAHAAPAERFVAKDIPANMLSEAESSPLGKGRHNLAQAPVAQQTRYIVELESEPVALYNGGVKGLSATRLAKGGSSKLNLKSAGVAQYRQHLSKEQQSFAGALAQKLPGAKVEKRFDTTFNGVVVVSDGDIKAQLAKLPGVKAVYPEAFYEAQMDASLDLIKAPAVWAKLNGRKDAGKGVRVAIIDSGIRPENPMFSDVGFTAPANLPTDDYCHTTDPGFCNNKLIVARNLGPSFQVYEGEYMSPLGLDGHGSHVAGTAVGNPVQVSLDGIQAEISGVAPGAYLMAYKALYAKADDPTRASGSNIDLLGALEYAVQDGADVINNSWGGGAGGDPAFSPYKTAFEAAEAAGVVVVSAAGNDGPGERTVGCPGCIESGITVANTQHGRSFANEVSAGTVQGLVSQEGSSPVRLAEQPADVALPLVAAKIAVPANEKGCNPFPADTFKDKIALISRGTCAFSQKAANAAGAGAKAMIVYNNQPGLLIMSMSDATIPAVMVSQEDGVKLLDELAKTPELNATITRNKARKVDAAKVDAMADSSSRGPNGDATILKPDLGAPGTNILSAMSPDEPGGSGESFALLTGTSMASPHVAGAAALVAAAHPDWTPAEIKTALTSTSVGGIRKEDGETPADPFDTGAGRLDVDRAVNAALAFDKPSVASVNCVISCSFDRKLVSLADGELEWTPSLSFSDPRVTGSISVSSVKLAKDGSADVKLRVNTEFAVPDQWYFGQLSWTDKTGAKPKAVMPIAIYAGASEDAQLLSTNVAGEQVVGKPFDVKTVVNNTQFDQTMTLGVKLPEGTSFASAPIPTVTGGTQNGFSFDEAAGVASWVGTLDKPLLNLTSSEGGYPEVKSSGGIKVNCGASCDDSSSGLNLGAIDSKVVYQGADYTSLRISTNGFITLGTQPSTTAANQQLPNPLSPNNVLAPFWTDLDLTGSTPGDSGSGEVYFNLYDGAGGSTWLAVEWNNAAIYGDTSGRTYTFQVWMKLGTDEMYFNYLNMDAMPANSLAGVTVGVENISGSLGQSRYYNGTGTAPASNTALAVVDKTGGNLELAYQVKAEDLRIAADDTLSVNEDSAATDVAVLTNDEDGNDVRTVHANVSSAGSTVKSIARLDVASDGGIDPSKVEIVTAPTHGVAEVKADGSIAYKPTANYAGTDSISYRVMDKAGNLTNTAKVNITVTNVNDAPTVSVTGKTSANGRETIELLATGTDIDGDALTYTWRQVSGPTATVTNSGNKSTVVLPNQTGSLVFEVVANDGKANSAAVQHTVSVTAVADPVASSGGGGGGSFGWLGLALLPLALRRRQR